jgi:HEAT repeat protein
MTEPAAVPTLPRVDSSSGVPGLGLAELLEALASPDPAVRAGAVARARPSSGVEEVLIQALSDPSPEVRAAAVRALARVDGRRAVEALLQVSSEDLSVLVRAEAIAAIGRILEARQHRPAGPEPEGAAGAAD